MGSEAKRHLANALRGAVGEEAILPDGATPPYRLGDLEPSVVVRPRGDADVARVLAVASAESLGVVPWGGGAHQSIGRAPARYDAAVDLGHMDRVVEYEAADMTATVQAGVRLVDLQRRLAEAGQCWPVDPPLADRATVGGIVASNLNGPLRCRYGSVRDLVLGVRVAHADGTITKAGARVVKNATAYDLTKLYVGSHGTLGILLEATLRLQPRAAAERGWLLTGRALTQCHDAALRILGSHLAPNRVELLDVGGAAACGLSPSGPALAVSFAGVREAVQDQAVSVERLAREAGLEAVELKRSAERWDALRDFPWRAARPSEPGWCARWRGGVLASECAKGMEAVREAVATLGEIAIAATVSHGSLRGTLRASCVGDLVSGLSAAREALQMLQGFLVVLEAPQAVHAALDPWGPAPAEISVMRQIRTAFDGKGVLNPGRFVDGL